MGYSTTRSLERMAAALGQLDGAPITFERVQDVPEGGVLCALPALLENGLLSGIGKPFTMAEGFYPIETIFLLLALTDLKQLAGSHFCETRSRSGFARQKRARNSKM